MHPDLHLSDEWDEYTRNLTIKWRVEWRNFAIDVQGPFTVDRLRRWAHMARRSRWPLLRRIVPESLRPEARSRRPGTCADLRLP
jgi:hypothetical protein